MTSDMILLLTVTINYYNLSLVCLADCGIYSYSMCPIWT